MSSGTKICKVCGKEYEYCKANSIGKFDYKNVACSPECGEEYFRLIKISRGEIKAEPVAKAIEEKEEKVFAEEYQADQKTKASDFKFIKKNSK